MRVVQQSAELLTPIKEGEMLELLEKAGRVCYKSESRIYNGSAPVFVQNIVKNNHQSVLEHISLSFRLITDRGVSHELVRHRLASYSQESTRYVRYDGIEFVEPIGMPPNAISLWADAMEEAESAYLQMLAERISPEQARSVLPNSTKTELIMTANLREWKHILYLRTSIAAHPQMRDLADKIKRILEFNYPTIFKEV